MANRFKGYQGRRRVDGLPDRRTREGKRAWTRSEAAVRAVEKRRREQARAEREAKRESKRRSDAAKKGWMTRKLREQEKVEPLPAGFYETGEWIVEEPIDTVGGKRYRGRK